MIRGLIFGVAVLGTLLVIQYVMFSHPSSAAFMRLMEFMEIAG